MGLGDRIRGIQVSSYSSNVGGRNGGVVIGGLHEQMRQMMS